MRQGELERDFGTERAADDRRPVDPGLVEHLAEVVDVRERPARVRRLAEAAEVDSDDAVVAREHRHLAAPHPPVGDPLVYEQDCRPVAVRLVRDRHWSARIA